MATPSPPQPPTAKRKRPSAPPAPIKPWSAEETMQLISTYQDTWHALRRGPLKSAHWEEIAASVAGVSPGACAAAKSALQCRHKMEKLRRRFRSESQRAGPSEWPFFAAIDGLLRGPFPISACPVGNPPSGDTTDEDSDEDRRLRRPESKRERSLAREIAAEVRRFSGKMAAVERRKMEMAREMERLRTEMEGKRIEMILRSQSKVVDAIARVLGSPSSRVKEERFEG